MVAASAREPQTGVPSLVRAAAGKGETGLERSRCWWHRHAWGRASCQSDGREDAPDEPGRNKREQTAANGRQALGARGHQMMGWVLVPVACGLPVQTWRTVRATSKSPAVWA